MKDELTVKQLFDIVRKGMIWRGSPIKDNAGRYQTVDMWLNECDITNGIFVVKGTAVRDSYIGWCKERGVTNNSVLGNKIFNSYLVDNFKTVMINNSKHYYMNKELKEDEEAKKKRQETYKTHKSSKETKS